MFGNPAANVSKETSSVRQNQNGSQNQNCHESSSDLNYQLQCGGPTFYARANDVIELNDEDSKDITDAERARTSPAAAAIVPLRRWVALQENASMIPHAKRRSYQLGLQRAAILRKITLSYAIGELLQHLKFSVSSYSQAELLRLFSVDNFSVHVSTDQTSDEGWEVMGVDMISPPLCVQLTSNLFSISDFFESAVDGEDWGRNVEAVIARHSPFCCAKSVTEDETRDGRFLCFSLGVLLHFLFSGENRLDESVKAGTCQHESAEDAHRVDFILEQSRRPKSARIQSQHIRSVSSADNGHDLMNVNSTFRPLHCFGYTHAVSQVVKNLLDCESVGGLFCPDDAYPSLEAAIKDLRLLLREPNIFLFKSNDVLVIPAKGKFYGRSLEVSALTDAFCRVASSGQSEAYIIGGFSGSGKTRLVESAFNSVLAADGMLVYGKFNETSNSQLSVVLSALDDLCIMIADRNTPEQSQYIWQRLVSEFGNNFHLLVRTLPNVLRLASSLSSTLSRDGDILSQDPVSLGLVHTILSDRKGASCLFFVGNYRDNEVLPQHIIFGFYDWLKAFNVRITTIHIDGMPEDDVNSMISNALGVLPRVCRSLSRVVFRKTDGNPFFVQTFLRSLIESSHLKYDLRRKCWTWDIDSIYAENITPNVLDLISTKMTNLSQDVQTALKVASCFGTKINISVARDLSDTPQYLGLLSGLNKAVEDNFMDPVPDGSYRFVHDKVREAAYGLICCDCKDQYHFDIGTTLLFYYESQIGSTSGDLVAVIDQINHGVPSLVRSQSQRISIARLNFTAGSKAMQCYDYISAYTHAKAAILLLPSDSWRMHYDLSLGLYFQLAKSAYPSNKIDEAIEALNKIVKHADCVETRLNGYTLLHSILFNTCASNDTEQLLVTIVNVLKSLGEDIPADDVARRDVATQVRLAKRNFERESDDALLQMHKNSSKPNVAIMQAYNILVNLSFIAKPRLYQYFVARWAQFCLKSNVACKYVAGAYVAFAVVLCKDVSGTDARLGYRIGKLGLKMLHEDDTATSELPSVYLLYFGFVAVLFEPLQACIDMHRRAYKMGLQIGIASIAAWHKHFLIIREIHSGTNLLCIKDEIEHDLKMAKHHSMPHLVMKLSFYYETVLTLIGDESASSTLQLDREGSERPTFDRESTFLFCRIVTSTYFGYFERVKSMAKKWEFSIDAHSRMLNLRVAYISFYYGLSLVSLRRRKRSKNVPEKVIMMLEVLKTAADRSEWNFKNKVSLLKAEKLSCCLDNSAAEAEYDIAIAAAKSSKFIHEEGLACELAGMHYKRLKNNEKAVALFNRAERCYKYWGSQKKSFQMAEKAKQISLLK
eukprot:CCRYP_014899-RB/>CCRYP_014899-RB protein AED:0.03 eAED:0.03 QI:211/1/1/1/1/1/6/342/1334